MRDEHIAIGIDGSPPSLHMLHVTNKDTATPIAFDRDAKPPTSALTVDRFQWNASPEKTIGPSGGATRLELRIVTSP